MDNLTHNKLWLIDDIITRVVANDRKMKFYKSDRIFIDDIVICSIIISKRNTATINYFGKCSFDKGRYDSIRKRKLDNLPIMYLNLIHSSVINNGNKNVQLKLKF